MFEGFEQVCGLLGANADAGILDLETHADDVHVVAFYSQTMTRILDESATEVQSLSDVLK